MVCSDEIAEQLAQYLLQIKAIKLQPNNPFTWSSGWKSPIYCDNRKTLAYPEIRTYIKENLAVLIREQFADVEVIAGVATAGIAHGALVADYLKLPYAYIRPEPKAHGLGKQIEGEVKPSQKVVLIEDLISTGKSSLNAIPPLVEAGCEILGCAAIFDYGFFISRKNFDEADCIYYTLSDYEHLLNKALELDYISQDDLGELSQWRENPESWGNK